VQSNDIDEYEGSFKRDMVMACERFRGLRSGESYNCVIDSEAECSLC